ncbi:MAG: glycine zipper 2TM domain-containing protein [Betaproteobacteria bacterium]
MDNNQNSTARLHPLVATAAVSLIVLSAAGVAAITGFLPKSGASLTEHSVIAPATSATAAAPGGITFEVPAAKPAPKPVVKKVSRPAVQARAPEPVREYTPEDYRPVAQAPLPEASPVPAPVAQVKCLDCGEIAAVNEVEQKGEGSWIGPVAGGVGGAILGKQVGKGSGNAIMTILGAAGGAYAGHKIEQKVRSTRHWEVVVRLEDGSTRTVSFAEQPAWRIGDRVRLNNGALESQQRT